MLGNSLRPALATAFGVVLLLCGSPAASEPAGDAPWASGAAPVPVSRDGALYRVSRFELRYGRDHAAHPPLDEVRRLEVELGWTLEGFVAPRDDVPRESVHLDEVERGNRQLFYASAIRAVNERIFEYFNDRGIQGVVVVPDPQDIEPRSNADLRPPDRSALRLVIWTGQLEELRTFASGDRIPDAERIDNPAHQRIKDFSPVQPGGENSLLRKDLLDDYVFRLNRHPGRNVDIALSAANKPGGVYLDYLVAENKPWSVYAQAANTGTDATTEWRERFGFTHNQLTGHDDILTLDYVTGNFQDVHAVFGAYEAPLYQTPRVRLGVDGAYSEFDASEVGAANFEGQQWNVGGNVVANVFQVADFFVDLELSARFYNVQINEDEGSNGNEDFATIAPAIIFDWPGHTRSFYARFSSETSLPEVVGTDLDTFQKRSSLGREDANDDFTVLRGEFAVSTFLEPLLFPRGWQDPTSPRTSTLAHEVVLDGRGQYVPGDKRLIPQFEDVAGGLYTVRGYDQSVAAGDHSALASFEYRLHVPRLLGIDPTPVELPWGGSFKMRAQQAYDQPDWDFIIRPFFDVGYIKTQNRIEGSERSSDLLLGTGIGAELSIRRNLIVRADWGHALRDVNPDEPGEEGTKAGNDEFHFSATISY
jgi:hypothetical protein